MTFERESVETTKHDLPIEHLARLPSNSRAARLTDTALRVRGTRISLGADSVLGLVPGIGDFASAAVSLVIVNEARRLGVPNDKLVKMLVNVGFDTVAGSVPVLGDVFDVYFKSNRRNLQLVLDHFGLDQANLDRRR
ncbi:DUF4112 domain-containing protein [Shinella sp. CPCC 101442]|uniref:DUF4112 domain-containing protein n=1 Tax=Shinella sp. CPCC 101442 TaxID=2932265 RepID=UPI0021527F8D|nr:DUF4112 domain-containing protein [Shinella sp. CPCC 101442]MCR6502878.1 DUF4112 domain-containing protein [Shinella sp. CPCC 101442]